LAFLAPISREDQNTALGGAVKAGGLEIDGEAEVSATKTKEAETVGM